MKKFLVLLGVTSSLFLAACADDNDNADKNATNEEGDKAAEETTTDVPKADLLKFYMGTTNSVNAVDGDLNGLEAALADEEPPTGDDLAAMKTAAKTSAENAKAAVEGMEVPAELDAAKDSLQDALSKLAEGYQMKADALAAEGEVNLEEANAKFEEADAEISKVFEDAGLMPSSYLTETN